MALAELRKKLEADRASAQAGRVSTVATGLSAAEPIETLANSLASLLGVQEQGTNGHGPSLTLDPRDRRGGQEQPRTAEPEAIGEPEIPSLPVPPAPPNLPPPPGLPDDRFEPEPDDGGGDEKAKSAPITPAEEPAPAIEIDQDIPPRQAEAAPEAAAELTPGDYERLIHGNLVEFCGVSPDHPQLAEVCQLAAPMFADWRISPDVFKRAPYRVPIALGAILHHPQEPDPEATNARLGKLLKDKDLEATAPPETQDTKPGPDNPLLSLPVDQERSAALTQEFRDRGPEMLEHLLGNSGVDFGEILQALDEGRLKLRVLEMDSRTFAAHQGAGAVAIIRKSHPGEPHLLVFPHDFGEVDQLWKETTINHELAHLLPVLLAKEGGLLPYHNSGSLWEFFADTLPFVDLNRGEGEVKGPYSFIPSLPTYHDYQSSLQYRTTLAYLHEAMNGTLPQLHSPALARDYLTGSWQSVAKVLVASGRGNLKTGLVTAMAVHFAEPFDSDYRRASGHFPLHESLDIIRQCRLDAAATDEAKRAVDIDSACRWIDDLLWPDNPFRVSRQALTSLAIANNPLSSADADYREEELQAAGKALRRVDLSEGLPVNQLAELRGLTRALDLYLDTEPDPEARHETQSYLHEQLVQSWERQRTIINGLVLPAPTDSADLPLPIRRARATLLALRDTAPSQSRKKAALTEAINFSRNQPFPDLFPNYLTYDLAYLTPNPEEKNSLLREAESRARKRLDAKHSAEALEDLGIALYGKVAPTYHFAKPPDTSNFNLAIVQEAGACFSDSIDLDPNSPYSYTNLGSLCQLQAEATADPTQAAIHYQNAKGLYEQALAVDLRAGDSPSFDLEKLGILLASQALRETDPGKKLELLRAAGDYLGRARKEDRTDPDLTRNLAEWYLLMAQALPEDKRRWCRQAALGQMKAAARYFDQDPDLDEQLRLLDQELNLGN